MSSVEYTIRVDSSVAIRLFMGGKLSLEPDWADDQAQHFLESIHELSYEQLLEITDSFDYSCPLDSNYVPQFADTNAIDNTVHVLNSIEEQTLDYRTLGYYLIREDRKDGAYRKYGENHGKGAALLGLINYERGAFHKSCLTAAYDAIPASSLKDEIRNKLYLRIPFIRLTLFKAKYSSVNAYDSIRMFTEGTMERRGQSPRKIFKELQACACHELNNRINNIFWEV